MEFIIQKLKLLLLDSYRRHNTMHQKLWQFTLILKIRCLIKTFYLVKQTWGKEIILNPPGKGVILNPPGKEL